MKWILKILETLVSNERKFQIEDRYTCYTKPATHTCYTKRQAQKCVFREASHVWLLKGSTLKELLIRVKVTNRESKECEKYHAKVNVAKFFNILRGEFEVADDYMHDIHKGKMNCETDITVDRLCFSSISKWYVGSIIIDFRFWFNNCKSAFRNVFSFLIRQSEPSTLYSAL